MKTDFKRLLDFATCNRAPGAKLIKLRDGGGLYLHIEPNGRRGWRFYYQRPDTKKQNTISFGIFPDVPLGDARAKCDAARAMLAKGKDPSGNRQEVQRAAGIDAAGAVTFLAFTNFEAPGDIGEFWQHEYIDSKRKDGSAKTFETLRCVKIQLRALQGPLGHMPLKEIKPGDIRDILKALSRAGFVNKAHRVYGLAERIFDLAVANELCEHNPAASCKSILVKNQVRKLPALTDALEADEDMELAEAEARVGELLRRIRAFPGKLRVARALEMMALTFPRPHNIVQMRWADIKGDLWVIGSGKMKMRRPHRVWLSAQALAILEEIKPLSTGERVFPMTKNCLTRALGKLGYDTEREQSTHGFRSIASTLLNESGEWSSDAIERQLAHQSGSKRGKERSRAERVRGLYNKAQHHDERKEMMQWWADYLDRLRRVAEGEAGQLRKAA